MNCQKRRGLDLVLHQSARHPVSSHNGAAAAPRAAPRGSWTRHRWRCAGRRCARASADSIAFVVPERSACWRQHNASASYRSRAFASSSRNSPHLASAHAFSNSCRRSGGIYRRRCGNALARTRGLSHVIAGLRTRAGEDLT